FDIVPGAKSFTVVAGVQNGPSATINIDPVAKTWAATYVVPSADSRGWNFSKAGFVPIDFLTGGAFPGGVIPLSRVDPVAQAALVRLPLPQGGLSGANAQFAASG